MMRALTARLLLVWAACVTACASQPQRLAPVAATASAAPQRAAEPDTKGHSRAPTLNETKLIRELMHDTERIRGLAFTAPVDVRIQDRVAIRAYVSEALDEDDLVRARRRYVSLGLIDPALDVRSLLESMMEEELIGYYDPRKKFLAVRDDVARSLGHSSRHDAELEWRATVVHELVHALQDQHLGLGAAMDVDRTTDADDAFGALVEGDATLAMLGYAAQLSGVPIEAIAADPNSLYESLHSTPERLTGALESAPALVREPLLYRYREGALFAAKLLSQGGWRAVDAAHRQLPDSTLVVSEPARYVEHRGIPPLPPLELGWLVKHGYEHIDDDVLGSFELGVALRDAGLDPASVSKAWRGDRYAVLARGADEASVWALRFADRMSARRIAHGLAKLPDSEHKLRTVLNEGALVLAVRGLDPALLPELGAAFRRWAKSQR